MMEKAKKPKAVSDEAAVLPPPPPEVSKGTSSVPSETNVVDRKAAMLTKYVAVPRELFGAASVVPVAGEEALSSVAVEASNDVEEGEEGGAAQKMDEVEDEDKDD
jgi:hypothetical protein